MPITNRTLPAGTVLVGRYKGQTYRCTVLENEGKLAFSLEDNSIHNSPSAAASKVMGGGSVNGWRFWTPEGEQPEPEPQTAKNKRPAQSQATPAPKVVRVIKKLPNQANVPEGSGKFWCSACMKSFVASTTLVPEQCPEGHAREVAEEFTSVATDSE